MSMTLHCLNYPQVLFWNGFKSPVHRRQTERPQLPVSPLPCIKESTAWFLRIFSIYYCSRQLLWKCNTKSLCHSLCSSTGKFLEVHSWSIVDHKLLSRWKIIATAKVTGKKPIHMNRRQNEKSTGEGEGPISSGKPSRGVMGKQPACAKWKVTPRLLAATSMFMKLAWMYLSHLCPQNRWYHCHCYATPRCSRGPGSQKEMKGPLKLVWKMGGLAKLTLQPPT